MDKELKYNADGYYDPTAYMALNNVQKGESMKENRTGEIWEIELSEGNIFYAIIIADDGNIVNFIRLIDEATKNSDIELNCCGIKYASSRMVQYCFTQKVVLFTRKLTDDEFSDILQKVADSLGIEFIWEELGVIEKASEPVKYEAISFDAELEKTKAQLEVYKDLYESLLQKMVG